MLSGNALYQKMANRQAQLQNLNTAYKQFAGSYSGSSWDDITSWEDYGASLRSTLSKDQQQTILDSLGVSSWAQITEDQMKQIFEKFNSGEYNFWAQNNTDLAWYNA